MSTIAKYKTLLQYPTIGVMIAFTALSVVMIGAPVNLARTQDCNQIDEYYDKMDRQCEICTKCPAGYGSTARVCGNGIGERGSCEPCQEGTYQDQSDIQWGACKQCRTCDDNAIVLSSCTPTTNTVCGPCKPGYGSDPNLLYTCSLCIYFNDFEKPPECRTATSAWSPTQSSPAPSSPSPSSPYPSSPYPYTISTHVYSIIPQQPTTETNTSPAASSLPTSTPVYSINTPQQPPTETNTSPAALVSGVIGISVGGGGILLLIGTILILYKKLKRTDKASETLDSTSQEQFPLNKQDESMAVSIDVDNVPPTGDVSQERNSTQPTVQLSTELHAMDIDGGGGTPETNPAPIGEGVSDSNAPADTPNGAKGKSSMDQQYCKKWKEMKHFARRTFKRSLSESEDPNMPTSPTKSTPPLQLSLSIREKCSKNRIEEEETKFLQDFDKACSYGTGLHWLDLDLSIRQSIRAMLTPSSPTSLSSFMELGEVLGLNRYEDLKLCKSVDDVFEKLSAIKQQISLEDVLIGLRNIKRNDVIRKLYTSILKEPRIKCVCN